MLCGDEGPSFNALEVDNEVNDVFMDVCTLINDDQSIDKEMGTSIREDSEDGIVLINISLGVTIPEERKGVVKDHEKLESAFMVHGPSNADHIHKRRHNQHVIPIHSKEIAGQCRYIACKKHFTTTDRTIAVKDTTVFKYMMGDLLDYDKAGMDVNYIYTPYNIKERQWILIVLDMVEGRIMA
ncbi:uncharacterized protein E5676_scaffold648G001300 [Cucumis melo var. makuwa]|uniref:Uncharacterized protein n=1 Tax=Cucumis melo var. makuwa TaxID=1194695 RepID=A0A5D3CAL0_CUCMM|nr:uncharacterized protein E6C27_scaffold115G001780 [Cucumis melo var. makuwa]TYK08332.1 uncharacterized protein E5676_scaffold648G001300 [Cucumis melo var. makuwa]